MGPSRQEARPRNNRPSSTIQDDLPNVPTSQFSAEQRRFRFTAGSSFAPPPPDAIDFRPDGPRSQVCNGAKSKADKARARTAKAREARTKKLTEGKASSNDTTNTRKSARITDLIEEANQLESELSSELNEVNIRDLEWQLREDHTASSLPERQSDRDFQPSSLPESTTVARAKESRKRKQLHSEGLSLNARKAGKRKIYPRKASHTERQ